MTSTAGANEPWEVSRQASADIDRAHISHDRVALLEATMRWWWAEAEKTRRERDSLLTKVARVEAVLKRGTLREDAERVHEFTHPAELAHRVAALTMATLDDLAAALIERAEVV